MVRDMKNIEDFDKYFIPNEEASFINNNGHRQLVAAISYRGKPTVRNIKAHKQSKLPTVSIDLIIQYINEFIDGITGSEHSSISKIELDGKKHKILGNCIIVEDCKWEKTYDKKYDVIKDVYDLQSIGDIVWIKFSKEPKTKDRYLGVVALSNDINFSLNVSSGKLITEVGHIWDESLVCIIPLTKEILSRKTRREMETGIGNYLEQSKHVPIIDYYSHNNF
ncbi:hypothetical protein [Hornefia butyriciproducens]|uniref:hypothetical protein n=1 Tax=Hornefia butyriciproducens TaxID=2652293 RepID=UPI0023F4610E|nr:hypothetical protein [Hornefia butyriciproducens]MDD6299689.1 hypothetical protein [Hornefia butyriciproducens]